MSRLSPNYHLGRHPNQCALTGRALAPGQAYIAAIRERDEDDSLEWLGFHPDAWDATQPPAGLFAWWNGTIPEQSGEPKQRLDHESLLDLFDQLAEATDERRLAFRFVLTLILIRKRRLAHIGTAPPDEAGHPRILVRRRGTPKEDPPSPVSDPQLTPEVLEDVTRRVAEVLNLSDEDTP